MNLRLFFEGKVAREEVASAFLATLLDQRQEVRSYFFDILADCMGQELAGSFKSMSWKVRVEVDQVDIRLDSNDGAWVILVENKLQAGSKQPGQLLRYYERLLQSNPASRIVAVYLAPGAMGESEVAAVKSSALREGDFAVRVSWNTIDERLQGLTQADPDGFVGSGIKQIIHAIDKARTEKYPNVQGRESIHDVACQVRDGLQQEFATLKISAPWPAKDHFILGTQRTALTLWLVLSFEAEPKPPYVPVHLFDGDKMRLTVHSKLKLSAQGSRNPDLKLRWRELARSGTVDVPGAGIQRLQHGWLIQQREYSEKGDHIAKEVTRMRAALLRVVEDWESGARQES